MSGRFKGDNDSFDYGIRAQFGEVTETNTDSHSLLPVSTENILVNNTFSVEMARQLIT